jgi:hypothetical protein
MAPRFRDLKRYCENTGWESIRDTDHFYYEKVLADGMVLKTKVSRALQKEILGNLWDRIRKHQLKVTEKEFWDGI